MNDNKPITEQQKTDYKHRLVTEIDEISQLIDELRKEFSSSQDVPTEEGDLATMEMERSDIRNRIQRYIERQKRIKTVINEFEDEFGFCIDCGIDMDYRRLNIDPTFRRCIDCEEIHQKKTQQYAQPSLD